MALILAHGNGIDELALLLAPLVVCLALAWWRRRRAEPNLAHSLSSP